MYGIKNGDVGKIQRTRKNLIFLGITKQKKKEIKNENGNGNKRRMEKERGNDK
jgi:hypothetical protein